jgi:hypothetical protein
LAQVPGHTVPSTQVVWSALQVWTTLGLVGLQRFWPDVQAAALQAGGVVAGSQPYWQSCSSQPSPVVLQVRSLEPLHCFWPAVQVGAWVLHAGGFELALQPYWHAAVSHAEPSVRQVMRDCPEHFFWLGWHAWLLHAPVPGSQPLGQVSGAQPLPSAVHTRRVAPSQRAWLGWQEKQAPP